jgi:hypothetical protein
MFLSLRENSFEEANCVWCFNHILQLSAKALLRLFNIGMSLTKLASEEWDHFNHEMQMLQGLDTMDNYEVDYTSSEDSDKDQCNSSGEDLVGNNDANSDEMDELDKLDEQEWEKILVDTAVV